MKHLTVQRALENGWSLQRVSVSADNETRRLCSQFPWDCFPDTKGTLERVTVFGPNRLAYGSIYIASISGKVVVSDADYNGPEFRLDNLPFSIEELITSALKGEDLLIDQRQTA